MFILCILSSRSLCFSILNVSLYRKKGNASVPIIPIVCAMLSISENTISETINVSISVDTKKDQSIFHVLFLLMHDKM